MKTKTTIACALALLSLAGRAFAQVAPAPVTGVTAQALNGQVVVQWNPVTTDPIDYYRVYYSNYSILENNGLYDDFEITQNNETTLTFVPPPNLNDLYIAVIAVASSGIESEFFTEETYVKVSTGGPAIPPPQPTPEHPNVPAITEHTTVKLLKGDTISPTEMRIEFSTSIIVEPNLAPQGLRITRSNGSTLRITGITINDKTIVITTEPQQRGAVYNVQFSEPFEGKNGQPLDANDRSVLLTGHPDSVAKEPATQVQQPTQQQPRQDFGAMSSTSSVASTAQVSAPYSPPDITNVTMTPQLQANGGYTVTLEWSIDNSAGDLYGIVVYQTRDGQTFGPPGVLPVDIRGVQIANVTPGFYGLYIQTVNIYGVTSPGVFQYATLPLHTPGVGLQGNLTLDNLYEGETVLDTTKEASDAPNDIATLQPITETSEMAPLEGAPKFAANSKPIDWQAAGLMATAIAGTIISIIGLFVMFTRRVRSV